MSALSDLRRAASAIRKKGERLYGLLGDFDGNITVADKVGYYYVRVEQPDGSYQVGEFAGQVRATLNLPVIIETNPVTLVQTIAGVDEVQFARANPDADSYGGVDKHATSHELGGDDILWWLDLRQIQNLRVWPHPTTAQHVLVAPGAYYAEGLQLLYTTQDVDLSSYYPVAGSRWVGIYLDSSQTVSAEAFTALSSVEFKANQQLVGAVRVRGYY